MILERAAVYKVPGAETRALHFAYVCTFGLKEPVFGSEYLTLCDDGTLLLLRTDDDEIPLLLHKARKLKYHISFQVFHFSQLAVTFLLSL